MTHSLVIWGGDVNLGRRQHYRTAELGADQVLGDMPALREAHLRLVNLECVVATTGEQGVKGSRRGPYYYRARPEMLRVLTAVQIDMVATANNHSGDYGPEALLEQGRWLDELGMGHTGSGADIEAALTPVIRRAGDLNVAVFALDATESRFAATADTPGTAYCDPADAATWHTTLAPRIAAARHQAHVVLVAVHWGRNNVTEPDDQKIAAGQALIDAGADAVLGANAHWLQGVEVYQGRPIIHDAGDLLFDSVRKTLRPGGLFRLTLSAYGVEQLEFIPIGVGFGFSRQYAGGKARKQVRRFSAQCAALGTELVLTPDNTGVIRLNPAPRPSTPVPIETRAPMPRYDLSIFSRIQRLNGTLGTVETVPSSARITPVQLGPLTLLGLKVRPLSITRRRMLWVETFWCTDTALDEDIRLNIRAVPIYSTNMPAWGKAMDHDPCDWMTPTRFWRPGIIYRDFYGLRPPRYAKLVNVNLQLAVGIISETSSDTPEWFGPEVQLAIPDLETIPNKAQSSKLTSLPAQFDGPLLYRQVFPSLIHACRPGQTWTAEQLEAVTGGTWLVPPPEGWFIRSLGYQRSFSRLLPAPFLFVAHDRDERMRHAQSTTAKKDYDRHADVSGLIHRLAGVMVSRPIPDLPPDFPVLQVADPIRALIELGLAARQRFQGPVVGITGTTGKSTTVNMLRQMLGESAQVLASMNNYNMRIDVPALLANLNPQHDVALLEIAQSALWMKRGPITRLIQPTIAVITEIGMSQTDRMGGSVQDTAKWKSRIFDGLTGNAVAVIGEHVACFEYIQQQAARHARRVLVFGTSAAADIRIVSVQPDEQGSRVELQTPDEQLVLRVPVASSGMVHNAVAAVSVLYVMGRNLPQAIQALADYRPNRGCLQQQPLTLRDQTVQVIDDSWNATVSSMRNAFNVLAHKTPTGAGRKIAVLGRMVHLGDLAQPLHEELAAPLLATGVNLVLTHGAEMHFLRARLPDHLLGPHWDDAPSVARWLVEHCQDGDVILVKGSRRDSDFGEIVGLLAMLTDDAKMPKQGTHANEVHTDVSHSSFSTQHSAFTPAPATRHLMSDIISQPPNDYSQSPYHGMGIELTEALLHDAARRWGGEVRFLAQGYYEIQLDQSAIIFRRNSPDHSVLAAVVTADWHQARKLLAHHRLPVADGAIFTTVERAERYRAGAAHPVCVKPALSSRGRGVTPNVQTPQAFAAAWRLARRYSRRIVVDAHVSGCNLRVLVSAGQAVGAYIVRPATVTGNGRDTIEALIAAQNARRHHNPWLGLWRIKRLDGLTRAGLSPAQILPDQVSVSLTAVASIACGADTLHVTPAVHPSLLALAEEAVRIFPGLHLACVSLMCHDITAPVSPESVTIIDIDAKPALADLMFPMYGPPMGHLADRVLDDAVAGAKAFRSAPEQAPTVCPARRFTPSCGGNSFSHDSVIQVELLRQAAHSRNLEVKPSDSKFTRLSDGDASVVFYKCMSHRTRVVTRRATNTSKDWTKQLLRAAGIPTPDWQTFAGDQRVKALQWAETRQTPVVVKPVQGSWGRGVSLPVRGAAHFERAWDNAVATGTNAVLVEEYVSGRTYRLFVLDHQIVAAAEILPASVTGNGTHTLQDLIWLKNEQRKENPSLAICPLVLDHAVSDYLAAQGIDGRSILPAGQHLVLHTVANIGTGGDSRDVTAQVHPDFAPIAVMTRRAVFDPPHVGIDIIAEDITLAPAKQRWSIIEVNSNPDIDLHHFPSYGTPMDVAGAFVESFFPDYTTRRSPPAAVQVHIQGRVQKVGFRRWLWRQAHLHALSGWVRNLNDGQVEAVFKGAPRAVEHITELCHIGPRRAKVEDVRVVPFAETVAAGFDIL